MNDRNTPELYLRRNVGQNTFEQFLLSFSAESLFSVCYSERRVLKYIKIYIITFIFVNLELGLLPEKNAELRTFKNMVVRRIIARKREDVSGS
jgi:hypothetical protein